MPQSDLAPPHRPAPATLTSQNRRSGAGGSVRSRGPRLKPHQTSTGGPGRPTGGGWTDFSPEEEGGRRPSASLRDYKMFPFFLLSFFCFIFFVLFQVCRSLVAQLCWQTVLRICSHRFPCLLARGGARAEFQTKKKKNLPAGPVS